MKKFVLVLMSIVIPFFVVGQDIDIIDENDDLSVLNDTEQNDNMNNTSTTPAGLGSVKFGFCNEGTDNLSTNLSYAVNIGQPFKVCTMFYNNSDQDITLRVEIVDGGTSAEGSKTCDFSSTNIQKFIDEDSLAELQELTLPAGQYVVKEFEITFPIGLEGNQSACYTYYIPRNSDGATVATIISNGSFMDFFVGALGDIKNEISVSEVKTYLDGNSELNLDFVLSNVGNLENKMSIKGELSNIFGFKREFEFDGKVVQLNAGSSTPVSIKLGSIPNYGGLFNIKFSITATPFFSYDISKSSIDPSLLEDKAFTVSTMYFQMPWLLFILVIMFILILVLLFKKQKKTA